MIRKWLMKMGVLILGVAVLMPVVAEANHIPTVGLGTAVSFAVLSGQGVTNTGPSVIKGDIGSHPNLPVTGFPPGSVQNGTINPSYTAGAKDALVTAYNDSAGRTPVTTIGTELGGQTLNHGIHDAQTGTFAITGTLTLDAQGDPSAVWIFKMAATLITGSSSNLNLINGASECNIFWQVGSSATLGPRVFPIADSFDAMTSDRPYRSAMSIDAACREIQKGSGTQFWPEAVGVFLAMSDDELDAIRTGATEWEPLRSG